MSSHILGVGSAPEVFVKFPHEQDSLEASSISIDEDFISNLKLEILAGTGFGEDRLKNARQITVNEEFAENLSLRNSAPAIGRTLILPNGKEVTVAGIVKDFHYSDLKSPIKNFFFEYDPEGFNYANVKLQSGDVAGSLAAMERLWKQIDGEGQFTAQLFSNEIKDAYSFYKMIIKLWGFLGLMALTVACMGLLGTVSFNIKKRFKEISIRKILGASTKRLVLLLSKDFILLMVIASVITIPVVYFLFTNILGSTQHYSIEIGFLEIFVSLIVVMFFGLTTILSQTLKQQTQIRLIICVRNKTCVSCHKCLSGIACITSMEVFPRQFRRRPCTSDQASEVLHSAGKYNTKPSPGKTFLKAREGIST